MLQQPRAQGKDRRVDADLQGQPVQDVALGICSRACRRVPLS
jgi:hypothetical protein